jgi:hypothetical protein
MAQRLKRRTIIKRPLAVSPQNRVPPVTRPQWNRDTDSLIGHSWAQSCPLSFSQGGGKIRP